ncbi:hypothetical protein C806_00529 [Lachnospiraceae bacterium 3-1]|nr:hypothetical protein C806_00529 [Lachnospiraceae bacterium 3-1]
MIGELIYKIWFRKQTILENYNVFKYFVGASIILGIILCTASTYFLAKLENNTEAFVILNIFSFVFTMYNLPSVSKEIKNKKSYAIIKCEQDGTIGYIHI